MDIDGGEILGLLGPNGAGKTTCVRILSGILSPSSGSVTIQGFDVAKKTIKVRKIIGVLFEQSNVYDALSGEEYLAYFAGIHGLSQSEIRDRSRELFAQFQLETRKHDRLGAYSKGMKRRIALARVLIHHPKAILLDEPTDGLDPVAAEIVRGILREVARQEGVAILMSSHSLWEVEALCDRVTILKEGQTVATTPLHGPMGRTTVLAFAHPPDLTIPLFLSLGLTPKITSNTVELEIPDPATTIPMLITQLVQAGHRIVDCRSQDLDLNAFYLKAIKANG